MILKTKDSEHLVTCSHTLENYHNDPCYEKKLDTATQINAFTFYDTSKKYCFTHGDQRQKVTQRKVQWQTFISF